MMHHWSNWSCDSPGAMQSWQDRQRGDCCRHGGSGAPPFCSQARCLSVSSALWPTSHNAVAVRSMRERKWSVSWLSRGEHRSEVGNKMMQHCYTLEDDERVDVFSAAVHEPLALPLAERFPRRTHFSEGPSCLLLLSEDRSLSGDGSCLLLFD